MTSRLFAPGHPCWARLVAEGRAPHARWGNLACTRGLPRLGHRPFSRPSVIMSCHGLRPALTLGRAERVPPRKPPPHDLQALRAGASVLGRPRRGGAGSARPLAKPCLHPGIAPFGPLSVLSPLHDHVAPRLAPGRSSRTRRARPSEKIALPVVSPAFPARPYHLGLATQPNEL